MVSGGISRQLAYYHSHKAEINKRRRVQRKAVVKPESRVKPQSISHVLKCKAEPSLKLRVHRLQRSYAILNAVSEDKLRSLKLNRLNNTDQYLGAGFRVTSRNLELEGIELVSDPRLPVAVLEGIAYSLADNTAQRIAASYSLIIAKEGHTPLKLTEIELSATQMTEKMEHKGLIELYRDAEGYKVWVDWSFGIGGLESNRPLYLQRLTDFSIDLAVDDAWKKTKEEIGGLKELAVAQSQTIGKFEQWLAHHDAQVVAATEESKANTNLINQLIAERHTQPAQHLIHKSSHQRKPSIYDSNQRRLP